MQKLHPDSGLLGSTRQAHSVHRNHILGSCQLRIGPIKGLSSSRYLFHILTSRKALTLNQIVEKVHEIRIESGLLVFGNEAEDSPGGIGTFEKLPDSASNINSRDRTSGTRDGTSTAKGTEPDHDLVRC